MSHDSLSGKVAIVTGGAGGLGKEIVRLLLAGGVKVVVCDVNDDLLSKASQELNAGDSLLTVRCDVTSADAVENLFEQAVKTFAQVDILVNNAGIMDKFDPVGDLDQALWDKVIAVNLTAPFLLTKAAVKHFVSRQATSASIVNIGSLSSERGFTAGAAYTASKHGLLGLSKNTAAFYKNKGIRTNLIMPGGMATNIGTALSNGINKEGYAMLAKSMEAMEAQMCSTEEVAKLVCFLASDDSAALTGAVITADKGWTSMY